jgi:hypothetical protein
MANVKVTVNIEVDGEPLKGFPYVRRFEPVDREGFESTIPSNAAFIGIPATGQVAIYQFLFFQALGAQMAIKLRGDGTQVTLNKGGFVLVVDSSDQIGTTIQNNSGSGAKAVGMIAGT